MSRHHNTTAAHVWAQEYFTHERLYYCFAFDISQPPLPQPNMRDRAARRPRPERKTWAGCSHLLAGPFVGSSESISQ